MVCRVLLTMSLTSRTVAPIAESLVIRGGLDRDDLRILRLLLPQREPWLAGVGDAIGERSSPSLPHRQDHSQARGVRMPKPASQWGDDTREVILDKIAEGKSLRDICSAEGMPSESLVRKWAVQNEDFGAQYARAREAGMEALADEILDIADSQEGDILTTEDGREIVNHDAIQRAKLRVDTRKWLMSKIAPKRYGDKLDLNHSGSIERLTDDALDARLAFLLGKARGGNNTGGEEQEG